MNRKGLYATIRVATMPGTNASRIGEGYAGYEGVSWRDSVDRCDSDGGGRVFLDCDSPETVNFVCDQLYADEDVQSFDVVTADNP